MAIAAAENSIINASISGMRIGTPHSTRTRARLTLALLPSSISAAPAIGGLSPHYAHRTRLHAAYCAAFRMLAAARAQHIFLDDQCCRCTAHVTRATGHAFASPHWHRSDMKHHGAARIGHNKNKSIGLSSAAATSSDRWSARHAVAHAAHDALARLPHRGTRAASFIRTSIARR